MPNGKFVEAPESDNGNPFAYWSVKETAAGKEIAKCFDRAFDLRATGDITVTACYTAEAQRVFISDASYSREQTQDAAGQPVDKLYADFILDYMEKDGKLLNPKYDNAVTDNYKTGLIVEYDPNIMLTKQDEDGETLSDDDKTTAVYPSGDVLSNENAKKLANGETLTATSATRSQTISITTTTVLTGLFPSSTPNPQDTLSFAPTTTYGILIKKGDNILTS